MGSDDRDDPALPDDFDSRLRAAKARRREKQFGGSSRGGIRSEGMAAGLRIAVELAAAVVVGTGIGIVLDRWLGTAPWLLIVFFLIGSAAGFLNVYRAAQDIDRRAKERRAAERAADQ
ncbi:AtpZ/AtpI family protein [Inquilinus sp. CAU 1745]|uniref:AtpZ/AtpI family protein n=1 Tax=Inquilinus sp. CAU 1745 TaxID=3140369 RepID=UPI00325B28B0